MNIVEQSYWDQNYSAYVFKPADDTHPIVEIVKKNVNIARNGESVFEIGCYPGQFLFHFGNLGYQVNGTDLTPRIVELKSLFESYSFNIGSFHNLSVDQINCRSVGLFDVVCSFGFIEHFTDYQHIILTHCELLKPKGVLIISTPNFSYGLRFLYQRILDSKNFRRHVLNAMKPSKWIEGLPSDIEVIDFGFCGNVFWKENNPRSYVHRFVSKLIISLSSVFSIFFKNSRVTSSYSYLIARRK
jgi:2-polyprenyl-3-methyl-5-hydroxy-6-metoxy-1,4-benzoquinol methylase